MLNKSSNPGQVSLSLQKLTELPIELRKISGLRVLDVSLNMISSLPPWIGELQGLEHLNIHGNELIELPPEIGSLKGLKILDAHGNRIRALPPEVGHLDNLHTLDLHYNELAALPKEFSNLTGVRAINLGANKFGSIPTEIIQLGSLEVLDIQQNRIKTIPVEIGPLLARGLRLKMEGNHLTEPLPELLSRGEKALYTYLQSLEDAIPHYEAKILLVGEGNVGKTSLVAALLNDPFVEGRPTTHGIEISSITLPHPVLGVDMTLRTWDFGGQEVYRITHQFFFSHRALYVVVWNSREGQEQNEVEGWVRRIRLRSGSNAPTLVVATHSDERNPELDYPELQSTFPDMLKGHLSIDNCSGSGIDALRTAIAREAAGLPQMGQVLSPRWTAVRAQLLSLTEAEPQITYRRFADICHSHQVVNEEIGTLAELLHDLGQVIYYGDDDGLRDIVVLNPEWLTKAIGYVLEDTPTRTAGGVLDHVRLNQIWRPTTTHGYSARYHPFFLRLMEKFDVSYRLHEDPGRSLVAQLVPHERPRLPWSFESIVPDGVRSLSLTCQLSEPAPGLIAWLTVRHHTASTNMHWRKGVFLRHPNAQYASEGLLQLNGNQELQLEVRAPSPDLYFNVLRDGIEELISRRWPGITYQIFVPCPTRAVGRRKCSGRFRLDGLLRYREKGETECPCLDCVRNHDISLLLTGFALPRVPLQVELDKLLSKMDRMSDGVKRIERYAAESASSVRRVLKAAAAEVADCPRLFSISPLRSKWMGLTRAFQRRYQIVLWCEHPGYWHSWPDATYSTDQLKDWLLRVAPYANLVLKTLKLLVPIGGAGAGVVLSEEQFRNVKQELDLMKVVVEKLPNEVPSEATQVGRDSNLTHAEGDALRAFRVLLFELDNAHRFGGLRRVQGPSGDFLWVCKNHYPEYDPGLPTIPNS